ncbi:protein translocase subunit SecF [Porticoccus sp.]
MTTQRILNFMGGRKLAVAFSLTLILCSFLSLATKGLVFGLDFTGGTQIEVGYPSPADLSVVRNQLSVSGFENPVVVYFGSESDVLVRMQGKPDEGIAEAVLKSLDPEDEGILEVRRVDYVGPQVGDELREDGGLGMLAALAVVMLYVAIRFQYKFAIGAVVALIHDVIITLGFFSITGLEVDLTVLAAVLAVIGYSLNDTIVVADRIRENIRLLRATELIDVINESLTQTLGRTVITSLTTIFVLIALFVFGGELIHNFSIALIVGIVIGTYSSIYVAANTLLLMGLRREDLLPPEKEGDEFDGLP